MIVIMGATGNTARPAVEALLSRGEKLRAIGRDAAKLQPFIARGAESATGNAEDAAFLARAFEGADTAYVLIPQAPGREDPRGYQEQVSDSIAKAVTSAGVRHVVALSSVGAQHAEKTGPIVGLHNMEQKLNAVAGLNVLYLRPTFFMENLFMNLGPLRSMGAFGGGAPADVPTAWIATRDIGVYAAERLKARDFSGSSTQELLGQRDLTMNEIARVLGAAIGKPSLSYMQVPPMMLEPVLAQAGLPKKDVALLIELIEAGNAGLLAPQEPRSAKNTTPTTIESFVAEVLAPAYLGKQAGA